MKPIELLKKLEEKGWKKFGHFKRNGNFIYLKKKGEVSICFCLNDGSFNENLMKEIK